MMTNRTTHKKELSQYEIDADKFWSCVDVKTPDKCWEWQRAINTSGYGLFSVKSPSDIYERTGRTSIQILAHRVAASTVMDVMPADQVMHECDNRKCCNPDHIRTGTPLDNHRDMVAKGRGIKGRKIGPRRYRDVPHVHKNKIEQEYSGSERFLKCLEMLRKNNDVCLESRDGIDKVWRIPKMEKN